MGCLVANLCPIGLTVQSSCLRCIVCVLAVSCNDIGAMFVQVHERMDKLEADVAAIKKA